MVSDLVVAFRKRKRGGFFFREFGVGRRGGFFIRERGGSLVVIVVIVVLQLPLFLFRNLYSGRRAQVVPGAVIVSLLDLPAV